MRGLVAVGLVGLLGLLPAAAWAGRANDGEVWAAAFTVPNGGGNGATAFCNDGQRVTGGGRGL